MGLSTSNIKTALHTWLTTTTSYTGDKVVWAYQNAPEPGSDFISVIPILSMQRIGQDERIYENDADILTRHRRSIIAQIDVYGGDAFGVAANAYDGLLLPNIHAIFLPLALSADYNSNIRNISSLKDGRYEARASFDVRISAVYDSTTLADDLGWWDSVQYTGTGGMLGLIPETTVN